MADSEYARSRAHAAHSGRWSSYWRRPWSGSSLSETLAVDSVTQAQEWLHDITHGKLRILVLRACSMLQSQEITAISLICCIWSGPSHCFSDYLPANTHHTESFTEQPVYEPTGIDGSRFRFEKVLMYTASGPSERSFVRNSKYGASEVLIVKDRQLNLQCIGYSHQRSRFYKFKLLTQRLSPQHVPRFQCLCIAQCFELLEQSFRPSQLSISKRSKVAIWSSIISRQAD